MKILLIISLLVSSSWLSFSQEMGKVHSRPNNLKAPEYVPEVRMKLPKRKNIYFELGGSGGFGSFNYELTFKQTEKFRWMFRTGISGTYIDKNNGAGFIFPVMVHAVYGKKHGLDLGVGQALTVTTRGSVFLRAPLSIGYRLEPNESRVFYRFSYTPIVSYIVDFQWQHWAGISVGYKLKNKRRWR